MTTIVGTGHRPDKLPGKYSETTYNAIKVITKKVLEVYEPNMIISGMALGFDQALCEVAQDLKIPVIAAVPFKGQEKFWPKESKEKYFSLLEECQQIIYVSEPGYSATKMQKRNQWMVDQLADKEKDFVLSLWNKEDVNCGTAHTLYYSIGKGINVKNIWDLFVEEIEGKLYAVS